LKCTSEPCFEKSQLLVEMGGTDPLTGRVRPIVSFPFPNELFGLIRVEPRISVSVVKTEAFFIYQRKKGGKAGNVQEVEGGR
jgi:hypothetical protein